MSVRVCLCVCVCVCVRQEREGGREGETYKRIHMTRTVHVNSNILMFKSNSSHASLTKERYTRANALQCMYVCALEHGFKLLFRVSFVHI